MQTFPPAEIYKNIALSFHLYKLHHCIYKLNGNIGTRKTHYAFFCYAETEEIHTAIPHDFIINNREFLMKIRTVFHFYTVFCQLFCDINYIFCSFSRKSSGGLVITVTSTPLSVAAVKLGKSCVILPFRMNGLTIRIPLDAVFMSSHYSL